MKDISRDVCRRMGTAVITGGDGEERETRGLVTRLKGQSGGPEGPLDHKLGELCRPLYVFTGDGEPPLPGDELVQGGVSYRVVSAEEMCIGGTKICVRAVLERSVEHDGE